MQRMQNSINQLVKRVRAKSLYSINLYISENHKSRRELSEAPPQANKS